MPLSFLNPGLLFGAAAAAVPLILHLLRNRRVRRVPFSDLRFLRQVEVRRSRTAGLRRWLLLLLRMLAILLLVGGAARPRWGGLAPADGDRVSLLVILDASASMQAVDEDGRTRFDEALDAAVSLTEGLPPGSEVQWLRAGSSVDPLFGDWLPARAAVPDTPAGWTPGDGAFDLVAALRGAATTARHAARPPLTVLVSDFQAAMTEGEDLAAAAAALAAVGVESIEAYPVGAAVDDGAVIDVSLPLRAVIAGETVTVRAAVRPARDHQIVRLELDGRVVGEAVTGAVSDGIAEVEFAVAAPEPGLHPGRVTLARDRIPADDQRAFVLDVRSRLRILLAHGAGRDDWRFLAHALAPDFASDDPSAGLIELDVALHDGWSAGDLDAYDVLVLMDPESLGRGRLAELGAWVQRGGGCWLVGGDPATDAYLDDHLLPVLARGTTAGGIHVRGEAGAERATIPTPVHPLLDGLPDEALDTLAEAEWRRSRRFTAGPMTPVVLLEGGAPLLLASSTEKGRVLVLASGLDRASTSLADNAMFPPLAHRAVAWLAADRGRGPELAAGAPLSFEVPASVGADLSGELLLVHHPADATRDGRRVPATLEWRDGRPIVEGPTDPGAGVWLVRTGAGVRGGATTVIPASESLPSPGDIAALAPVMEGAGLSLASHVRPGSPEDLGSLLSGRDLARWCFLAAALALLLETWISRGERPRRTASGT